MFVSQGNTQCTGEPVGEYFGGPKLSQCEYIDGQIAQYLTVSIAIDFFMNVFKGRHNEI